MMAERRGLITGYFVCTIIGALLYLPGSSLAEDRTSVSVVIERVVADIVKASDLDKQSLLAGEVYHIVVETRGAGIDESAVNSITSLVRHHHYQVAAYAVRSLGIVGSKAESAVPELIKALDDAYAEEKSTKDLFRSVSIGDVICSELPKIRLSAMTPHCRGGDYLMP